MRLIKKTLLLWLGVGCFAVLFACGGAGNAASETATIGAWDLAFAGFQVKEDLRADTNDVQYSGVSVRNQISESPDQGNVFLLVHIVVEKKQASATVFYWDGLSIQDADGNNYHRMENDSFLENFGYERLMSTDLTLGKNDGYICFEIPKEEASKPLSLCYQSDEGSCSIKLR